MALRVVRRFMMKACARAFDGWSWCVMEKRRSMHAALDLLHKVEAKTLKEAFAKWEEFVKQHNPHRFFDDMVGVFVGLSATVWMRCAWDRFHAYQLF